MAEISALGSTFLFSAIFLVVYMSVWYAAARMADRLDLADVAWGLGFIALTLGLLVFTGGFGPRMWLVGFLVACWGLRLAAHIALRLRNKPEDARYAALKKEWKNPKLEAFPKVFLVQGGFLLLVAAPIIVAASAESPALRWYNWLGAGVWLVGFYFETVGDRQLDAFKNDPQNKGRVMRSGLWRYTRHPNYFGEVTQWWGLFLVILFVPYWYIGAIGPVTITFLILGLSGIPMLEKRYQGNPEFEDYKEHTSAFFPLPPKKRADKS